MKNEYELLKNLFSGNQMPEIIRYNDEYKVFGNEEDFIDMIWYEVQAGTLLNKEQRNRIFKNSIILSSRLLGMDAELDGLILLDMALGYHLDEFEKDNGSFTEEQLLEFFAFSNNLVWGYYYSGNDKLTVENLDLIKRIHQYLWTSIKAFSKTKIPNYLACTYFEKNYRRHLDKIEYTKLQFLEKERIEELVIYLTLNISHLIDYEELEERDLSKNKEFLTELKSFTKDLKEDYETDNDIFDDIYAELLEVEDKPNFNELLILLLNKSFQDINEYYFDEETKQKIIDVFRLI